MYAKSERYDDFANASIKSKKYHRVEKQDAIAVLEKYFKYNVGYATLIRLGFPALRKRRNNSRRILKMLFGCSSR
jgi:hypothetical protein